MGALESSVSPFTLETELTEAGESNDGVKTGMCLSLPGILVLWPFLAASHLCPTCELFASPCPIAAALPPPANTQAGGLKPTALLLSGARERSKVKQVGHK